MKHLSQYFLLAVLMVTGNAAWSHGDVTCKVPKTEWRPSVELQRELKKQGWTVRKIQVENGCYEVYGFDEKDKRVEAWFDPKSFARVG
jgi:hypothetical protein